MRAYVAASPKLSAAMRRVAEALARFRPAGVDLVPTELEADLVVLHVIGYPETETAVAELLEREQRYAVMQYCLRSTQRPNTRAWLEIWRRAACVWSYYDLAGELAADGLPAPGTPITGNGPGDLEQYVVDQAAERFYIAPLGADPEIFMPLPTVGERYGILTSGYVAESECVAECTEAAARAGRRVFHLGPRLECHRGAEHVDGGLGISDVELARAYSRSDFVAGMRRCEGFEMPAAEGLLCGARPLMLDRPHYRRWFEPWAVFVPEVAPPELTDAVEAVLRRGVEPITPRDIRAAQRRFNWQPLVEEFWRRCLATE